MGSFPKHRVVLMVIAGLLVLMDHTCEAQHHEPEREPPLIRGSVHIKMQNALADKSATLTVHCSGLLEGEDDDLGSHDVAPGSTYEFRFETDSISVTSYNCSFQWPPKNSQNFNIFSQGRDGRDGDFYWLVSDSGPCLVDVGTGNEDCKIWS
ncbi:S-protein homolog 3-like [Punica granatum]|uniref:S-protein homolog 3-like n=2 Tax=Punica granatum TaxID=22663 RepID=A0A6P8EBI5_PUNGR|nr:S-protein homolog 3-like [Punica granatum]XP_031404490.1 S-protein homolog 3-like [Punica granatum]PKH93772.1 hypothetical protein CRG98_049823 [Punica granatum]